jgi:hypothetical protein
MFTASSRGSSDRQFTACRERLMTAMPTVAMTP